MKNLFELLKFSFQKQDFEKSSLQWKSDKDGLGLMFSDIEYKNLKKGTGSDLVLQQFIFMQMLLEEGIAEPMKNGIYLNSDDACKLDESHRHLFKLPPPWPGSFTLEKNGLSYEANLKLRLDIINERGERKTYKLKGPVMNLGDNEAYLFDSFQFQCMNAISKHSNLALEQKGELANLLAIHELFDAKEKGVAIELSGFGDLKTVKPLKIGLGIEELENGDLELIPGFGVQLDANSIKTRLGQLGHDISSGSLRIKDKIIILNEHHYKATQEIIKNRIIPAKERKQFFKTPSAFLDTSLVDLDLGFSLRVKGAGPFKHAYFGETDKSDQTWFEDFMLLKESVKEPLLPPSDLKNIIKDLAQLEDFQKRLNDALLTGADEVSINHKSINIKDTETVHKVVNELSRDLSELQSHSNENEVKVPEPQDEPTILLIETGDESIDLGSDGFLSHQLPTPSESLLSTIQIDSSEYKRNPFPHQLEAIKWLTALATNEEKLTDQSRNGALLADDMGLGKTYSALVFIQEYLKWLDANDNNTGPVLVVAPLILLETWKREVEETYCCSPFDQIIVLQADKDLPAYRLMGMGKETKQKKIAEPEINQGLDLSKEEMTEKIRFALKINKLKIPKQLILTTYDTMRDFQFSLALIDWSVIVFDEAQNIKNPNSLQTHAAKALKSNFKLLATGTPVENSLKDFWSLFDCLEPGFLDSYQNFRKEYILPILKANTQNVTLLRNEIGTKLRNTVGGYMLRRTKEDELKALPKKQIILGELSDGVFEFDEQIKCYMAPEQLTKYYEVLNSTIDSMKQEKKGTALQGLHLLRSVSLHPQLLSDEPKFPQSSEDAIKFLKGSGKLNKTLEILQNIQQKNEKVIIFLINKKLQRILSYSLLHIFGFEVDFINGDVPTTSKRNKNKTRHGILDNFCSSTGFNILIMSPVAAGVGLTITEANHVIHLERHWNPAKEAQATDRVYRIGQDKDVFIYLPTLVHDEFETFDVKLNNLLQSKLLLKDAIVTPEPVKEQELFDIFGGSPKDYEKTFITIKDVPDLSWQHFEALIAEIFSVNSKDVILTSKSYDHNCDVVVFGEKQNILIQCKHHKNTKKAEDEKPIYEIHSSRDYYENALDVKFEKLLVYTTSKKFEKQAQECAEKFGVDLRYSKHLESDLKKLKISFEQVLYRDQNRMSV